MGQKELLKVKALSSHRHKPNCGTSAKGCSVPTIFLCLALFYMIVICTIAAVPQRPNGSFH